MILAWLLLLTGLTISAVAIYYSVVGLAAIFSAAVIPIIVMGSALEIAKLVCASWLKANWSQAPRLMKIYMTTAVAVLMLITSMGIFGFLSKAHSDQSLVSGDVMSKISIYDEKIKTAKDNIDANRKALKQMDESVDQSMARSNDEKGADKAVALRRSQAKERARLQQEIQTEQKTISTLNDEAAPIRAEVRKVEAEVGPLKYIAAFVYGATDESVLERAVTWVIITIIVVFDPLAVIMLLAAQMTFAWHRKGHDPLAVEEELLHKTVPVHITEVTEQAVNEPVYEPDNGALTEEQLAQINDMLEEAKVIPEPEELPVVEEPVVAEPTKKLLLSDVMSEPVAVVAPEAEAWNKMIEDAEKAIEAEKARKAVEAELDRGEELIQAEESNDTKILALGVDDIERPGDYLTELDESKKKTYMTKDSEGKTILKEKQ